jgi:hypothetical protein
VELIAPYKHEPEGSVAELWSDTVELIRRDVECVFGILKKKFMILKHPMRFPEAKTLENIVLACCVLHNMLCDYDGRDDWETRLEHQELEGMESDVENDGEDFRERILMRGPRKRPWERVGLTRHMRRQLAIENSSDDRALRHNEENIDTEDGVVLTLSALAEYKEQNVICLLTISRLLQTKKK